MVVNVVLAVFTVNNGINATLKNATTKCARILFKNALVPGGKDTDSARRTTGTTSMGKNIVVLRVKDCQQLHRQNRHQFPEVGVIGKIGEVVQNNVVMVK